MIRILFVSILPDQKFQALDKKNPDHPDLRLVLSGTEPRDPIPDEFTSLVPPAPCTSSLEKSCLAPLTAQLDDLIFDLEESVPGFLHQDPASSLIDDNGFPPLVANSCMTIPMTSKCSPLPQMGRYSSPKGLQEELFRGSMSYDKHFRKAQKQCELLRELKLQGHSVVFYIS